MEAENKKARLKAKLRFTLVFAIALIVTTTGGVVTIVTAQKGISLLESKKAEYDNVFKKQAELNFQIEELFRNLNNLKTKRRNSSEHKHMQKLITKKRLLMLRRQGESSLSPLKCTARIFLNTLRFRLNSP